MSPHFDLDEQLMVKPKHLDELTFFISSNTRLDQFERDYLVGRLLAQGSLARFERRQAKQLIKKIRLKHKNVREPPYFEIYGYIESLCWGLYSFIARGQIEQLQKLGLLGEWLSGLTADDLRMYKIELKQ